MAKTIKFNLILDGYPVRDLDGLREHFSLEDMLAYYKNGLLLQWLNVRGYRNEEEQVKKINKGLSNKDIIEKLSNIFNVDISKDDICKAIGILTYLNDIKRLNEDHRKNGFQKKKVIDAYHVGYAKLINKIIVHKDEMPLLKANVIELEREYYNLFELDYQRLFSILLEKAPKAIFAILSREKLRGHWIEEDVDSSINRSLIASKAKIKTILGNDVRSIQRNTQGMWDQIERSNVKIMVLWLDDGIFVKNAGAFAEKLGREEVKNKFLLLNGLEYQCISNLPEMLYMEV